MSIREKRSGPMALEAWARHHIDGYRNCTIKNMTTSWRNGLAFCALIHRYRPDLINYDDLDPNDIVGNCTLAFETAERQLGIPALLDPMDMLALEVPDRLSVLTYVAQFYNTFKNMEARPFYNGNGHSASHHEATPGYERRNPGFGKRTLDVEDEALHEARKKLSGNSSPVMLRNKATCSVCENPVFISERILFNKKLYHRSCFRCFNCDHVLNPQTADISSEGLLFCLENTCYTELQKRSRESRLNVSTSTSSTTTTTSASPIISRHSGSNNESSSPGFLNQDKKDTNENDKLVLPNVSALKKSFESGSSINTISSSGVSSETYSLDSTTNQIAPSISHPSEETTKEKEPKIRFDEIVTVKSSVEVVNSKDEIVAQHEELKSANDDGGGKDLHDTASSTSLHSEPSDVFVLRPGSSLVSQIQQREEDEIVRRNTAANEISSKPEPSESGIEIKPVKEVPNIYSESGLPVAERFERDVQKLDDGKKNQFLSGMLTEKDDNVRNDNFDKENSEAIEEAAKPGASDSEPEVIVKLGPEVNLELEPGTEVVVKHEVSEPEVRVQVEDTDTIESREDMTLPSITPPRGTKSEIITSSSTKEPSPGPSPMPRRKSPAPSTTSTTSAMSLQETPSASSPAPTPRRVKKKPPRPAPPSKESLTSLSVRKSVPSAKELWKKEDYYPSELNPFESEEELPTPTRPNSTTIVAPPAAASVPGNPFEEDDDEPEPVPVQSIPSPKPSPRVRSARNQVNSVNEGRSRSHSRSRSRSPSRKFQNSMPSSPKLSPRVPRPMSMPVQPASSKPEPKPYNPFEDDEDEENAEEPQVIHRRQGSDTNSETSSRTTPVPKARQSLPPSTTSSAEGSIRKSNKTKRAPLPPTHAFTATSPSSPKSILKHANQNQSPYLISPSSISGSPKKLIPASPDLLRGLNKPKKKRRAPPPRRRVEPLPEEQIKREMNDLIVKEREFERQGITLESNIRRLMEQQESTVSVEPTEGSTEEESVGSSIEQQLDEMMVQLWNIVNEKNEILRRQTELEYLRRGHRLEEMQAELEFKLRVLMDTPVHERQDDYAQVEQTLLDELLKLVDERNDVVEWLDFQRKQDREDDVLVSSTITSYSTTASLQRQKQENAPVELIKEEEKSKSKKSKKDKHKSKDKNKDKEEKDKDKQNGNIKIATGEKTEKEKEKKSKIKTLLFGKKKHKGSLKNEPDQPELPTVEIESAPVNGSESATNTNAENTA